MCFYATFSTTIYSQLAASAQPASQPFPTYPPILLSTHASISLPICLLIYPPTSLPIHSPTYLPIHPSIYTSTYLPIYLPIPSSIYLATPLPMDPIFYPFLKPHLFLFKKIQRVSASFSAPMKAKTIWYPSLCILSSLVFLYCLLLHVPRSLGMVTARCPSHVH